MTDSIMFHEGNRRLQDQFESRRIADRLENFARTEFAPDDRAFIERAPFVMITAPSALAFPDYDGNGMFKSLGNILVNVEVGMLFIAMHGKPQRLRVNGTATVSSEDPLLERTVGAQLMVRVTARVIFPNCPRYIPDMQLIDPSIYLPRAGFDPPEPAWKGFDSFKDCIHPRQLTFRAD